MTSIKIYKAETNADVGVFITNVNRWLYFSGVTSAYFTDFDESDFNDFYQRTDIGYMTNGENIEKAMSEFITFELIDG